MPLPPKIDKEDIRIIVNDVFFQYIVTMMKPEYLCICFNDFIIHKVKIDSVENWI